MTIAGKWGTSRDGEWYCGAYDTKEQAIAAAMDPADCGCFVGQYREPVLEQVLDAEDLLEKVLCQDDYCGDWAEDALPATPRQLEELTGIIRRAFAAWVDRHGLRPTFGIVEHEEEIPRNS